MTGKPKAGGGMPSYVYAVVAFGLVPTSMVLEIVEPVLGNGVAAQATYWTVASVALLGLARRVCA